MKQKIPDILQSKYSIQALDFIFKRPIFSSSQFIDDTHIPRQSALKIIKDLEKAGIITIHLEGRGRTPNSYKFERLLDLS